MAQEYRERNSTADRALNILQMFTLERTEISAVDVAESLKVARSTAYRYLQTLVQAEFLTETGRSTFRLGLRVLDLARIARKGFGLSETCLPLMRELAARYRQTVLLTKLMGNSVVCLEREEAQSQYVRLSYERGSVMSINAGASALSLLAWSDHDDVRRLLDTTPMQKFTSTTLVDADEIVARLAEIRSAGYSVTLGEVDPTVSGIAAPIQRENGEVVAALSMVVVSSLVTPDELEDMTRAIVDGARELSNKVALLEL